MNDSDEVCPVCTRKLYDGTPVHGARGVHWDCLPPEVQNPPTLLDMKTELKRADDAIARLITAARKLR